MNIQHLLKQAQQMQNQIGKVEKEIEATEYTATAGGDAVKVTLTGKMEVTSIEISEDLLTADSREMLQDTMMIADPCLKKKAECQGSLYLKCRNQPDSDSG